MVCKQCQCNGSLSIVYLVYFSSPLFGDDDNVADTFGETFNTTAASEPSDQKDSKKKKPEVKELLEDVSTVLTSVVSPC